MEPWSRPVLDVLVNALRARSSDPGAGCRSSKSHYQTRVDLLSHLASLLARRFNAQIEQPRRTQAS